MSFFNYKEGKLASFGQLAYESKSHNCNKAVIAAYYNVKKYGYKFEDNCIRIDQTRRTVFWIFDEAINFDVGKLKSDKPIVLISEKVAFKKKEKEVCYDLKELFTTYTTPIGRGIKFSDRKEVKIMDYKKDENLDLIYNGWKQTKEDNPKVFLMSFNPARYYRSYELLDYGFQIYQKIVMIKQVPYALINFALQGEYAYELSFLSLYKNTDLKLINDQNDCIIINCLCDLHRHGIKYVNLGTSAGIKGLAFFKRKLPHFEQIVYTQ